MSKKYLNYRHLLFYWKSIIYACLLPNVKVRRIKNKMFAKNIEVVDFSVASFNYFIILYYI